MRLSDYIVKGAKAKWYKGGNVKLGKKVWTFSTLYGDGMHYVAKFNECIQGTCGGYCHGCKNDCYVRKSYRYGSVILGHACNTLAVRYNIGNLASDLGGMIDRARNKPDICRLHQSGELVSDEQLEQFFTLADEHPEQQFYIYTKAYDILLTVLSRHNERVPKNLTILVSIWHETGIQVYRVLKHIPNIKAFVYDDGTFDYTAYGLDITTWCKAYDENGKLDHNVTCDKCRKCFNRGKCSKIIGCKAH